MNEVLFVCEEQDKYEARTERGYVLLSRAFTESSLWLQSDATFRVALFLIARVNWKPGKFPCRWQKKEMIIQPGEIITTIGDLTAEMNENRRIISQKQVRTALKKLEDSKFLQDLTPEIVKRAKGYTLLRLLKYHIYQNPDNYKGKRGANEGQTEGNQRAYIETYNKGIRETYNKTADSKKNRPPANPEIKLFIDFWHKLYTERMGDVPLINGEHGKLLQGVLRQIGLDTLEKMAIFAFDHRDGYTFLNEKGYPLKLFLSSASLEEIRKDMRELGEL